MLTREDLMHMRNMSFEDINPAEIPDLDEMNIDVTKSKREKILGILESGNIVVKVGFASTSRTIEEALESLVQMKW